MHQEIAEKIAFLERFKADIQAHFAGDASDALRTRISRAMPRAKSLLSEVGVLKTVTLSPPPAVGGLLVRNGDPFSFILQDYYGMSMIPTVADMIEEGIGVLESPEYARQRTLASASAASSGSRRTPLDRPNVKPAKDQPELPEKVTISWLVQHVPISFWFWLVGILAAAFFAGTRIGPLITR